MTFLFQRAALPGRNHRQGGHRCDNDGALYFSSAGNEGNFDTGTSGVWQGDFKSGGSFALIPGGDVHDFGKGTISNFILADGFAVGLFWSDPQGASSNDYDLYMMSPNLDEVLDASTDVQDGSQDPFEILAQAQVCAFSSSATTEPLFVRCMSIPSGASLHCGHRARPTATDPW